MCLHDNLSFQTFIRETLMPTEHHICLRKNCLIHNPARYEFQNEFHTAKRIREEIPFEACLPSHWFVSEFLMQLLTLRPGAHLLRTRNPSRSRKTTKLIISIATPQEALSQAREPFAENDLGYRKRLEDLGIGAKANTTHHTQNRSSRRHVSKDHQAWRNVKPTCRHNRLLQ